jgi:eukaryotic-like serine/threonine-protein kinase
MQRTGAAATNQRRSAPRNSASRYINLRPIGAGGTGVVYEADDTRLQRRVALKFSSSKRSLGASALRLLQEGVALAAIDHAHICRVYDVDLHQGRPCIVMERLEGTDLKQHMAGRKLGLPEIVSITLQIVDALEAAHLAGIIHQDIKPANIFITARGAVKLLDFGLAETRRHSGAPAGTPAAGREVLGTISYLAPERILKLPITPRSDLFSLGAVIYELATGQKPFTGATPAETIFNVLDHEPRRITAIDPALSTALDTVVMKLLEKLPARRYQSAADLRQALLRIRPGRLVARSPRHITISTTQGDSHDALNQ